MNSKKLMFVASGATLVFAGLIACSSGEPDDASGAGSDLATGKSSSKKKAPVEAGRVVSNAPSATEAGTGSTASDIDPCMVECVGPDTKAKALLQSDQTCTKRCLDSTTTDDALANCFAGCDQARDKTCAGAAASCNTLDACIEQCYPMDGGL